MKKYISVLLILSILTISAIGGSVLPAPEQYHKPKIKYDTIPGYATNWAGYAVNTTGGVTDVKGSWVVPKASCVKGKTQYSSFWTGIDGDNSPTVEQIGTDSDCKSGRATYYTWYEFYPNPGYYTPVSVSPGDKISTEVSYNPASALFTVSITNLRTGSSYSTSSAVSGAQRSSAEWIAEAPSSMSGILPLANFGTAYFGLDYTGVASTSYATVNGVTGNINDFNSTGTIDKITMVNTFGTAIKAQPSPVSPDGTSFSVQWKSTGP